MNLLHRPSSCTQPNLFSDRQDNILYLFTATHLSWVWIKKKRLFFPPIIYSIPNKGPITIINLNHAISKNFYYCTLMLSASYIQRKRQ
jgi:hypothetical protein